ncbi:MAG TPA: GlsB/YeaQ/YmgE family stress response membrane protein [Candidatus Tectomicrobia bacterium]
MSPRPKRLITVAAHKPTATRRRTGEMTMFSLLGWIIFGLIVGALAKLVMPGRDPGGIIVTIVLGIVGALLGGWLGRAMGWYGPNEAAGFVMALIGALLLLGLYRLLVARRA